MKPIKYIGAALVAAAALGFVACNNDSVNAPDFSGSNSSAVEQRNQQTSSSSFAKREPGSSGDVALSSDEKIVTQSSSSVAISSSGKNETCKHVTDIVCEPCPPGEKCSCHPCDSNKEFESRDCSTVRLAALPDTTKLRNRWNPPAGENPANCAFLSGAPCNELRWRFHHHFPIHLR